MEALRKPYIGVWNIIRFNWHFYLLALGVMLGLIIASIFSNAFWSSIFLLLLMGIFISVIITLIVSHWVYDRSDLYEFALLSKVLKPIKQIINIHAGLDESSLILKKKFPNANLDIYDFYDPKIHTEVSIKRARKHYPPLPGTQMINTINLDINIKADLVCLILAAHEIRNEKERIQFFKALTNALNVGGAIYVVEHLRDLPNFLAFNIGYLHFISKTKWLKTFQSAGLEIKHFKKTTPFVNHYILEKHGITS